MKKYLVISLLCLLSARSKAQYVVPDTAFVSLLQTNFPWMMTGNVLDTLQSTQYEIMQLELNYTNVTDLSGIQYFDRMDQLLCRNSPVGYIPEFPTGLSSIWFENVNISNLPAFPDSLLDFRIIYSPPLTSLPTLPDSLLFLHVIDCPIINLPTLPSYLEHLTCSNAQLTSLPGLPSTLGSLSCADNYLTFLPPLPANLGVLEISQNQFTSLPTLPVTLYTLFCSNNQISCLPNLPVTLSQLNCQGNLISCLPNVPEFLPPFGTGIYESNLGFSPVVCGPGNACFPAEVISGILFNDMNGNGMLDAGESPFAGGVAEAMPGNTLSSGDLNGRYVLPVGAGTFTVQGQEALYHTITTAAYAITIAPGQSDSISHIGYQAIPGVYDLVAEIQAGVTRPGFNNNVYLQVRNMGTEATTATINLDFESNQTWVTSAVAPGSQTGNTASWTMAMAPGDTWNTTVTLHTDASAPLGLAIDHDLNAMHAVNDTTPTNNSAHWHDVTVGSYDPNDKTATPPAMLPAQLANGEPIDYTIRFQNTGTYVAENVSVTDTLSSDLLHATFEYISASHANHWLLNDGVLVFQFDNILLPDSNANEPASHGFVKFRIYPSQDLEVDDSVTNIANIYFDYNQPVITEPCVFVIDATLGFAEETAHSIQLYPNPTNALLNVTSTHPLKSVSVLQLDGRLVLNERATGLQHQLDLSTLQHGVYLINVVTEGGRFTSRVVIGR